MKKNYTSFAIGMFLTACFAFSCNNPQSTHQAAELNASASETPTMAAKPGNLQQAESTLDRLYNQLLQEYEDDAEFIRWLTASQELWRELRDANMYMRFPHKDDEGMPYGTAFSDCYNSIMTDLTNERISFLNQWAEGIEEGDVCTGSIKFKN